jgi:RNA polymerase sigma factor (TIGR02999 family)
MSGITQILTAIERGEPRAAEELLPLVYTELRRLAAQKLSRENPAQTLQATALVHEAWLRLVHEQYRFNGRRHFFLAAAEAMRRILVENARRKQSLKHGGHLQRVDATDLDIASPLPDDQLLAVDEALDRLAAINPRAAEVVKLRFFAGLTEAQVAEHLGVSVATIERIWAFARAWLFNEIPHDQNLASGVRENAPENRV